MSYTFTEDEVKAIIGCKVDIQSKFEEAHQHDGDWCLGLELDDEDSEEAVGIKMAYYASFVSSIAENELIDKQLCRMRKASGAVR